MEKKHYSRFLLTLAASFAVMYAVMYANVADLAHAHFSLNRFYMTVLMVAPMALIMLGSMRSMYTDSKINRIIVGAAIACFAGAFAMLRTQTFVNDAQFMNSMIPHHSSAILVSREATLRDPEVQELARRIIRAQEEEIAQMKKILARMQD